MRPPGTTANPILNFFCEAPISGGHLGSPIEPAARAGHVRVVVISVAGKECDISAEAATLFSQWRRLIGSAGVRRRKYVITTVLGARSEFWSRERLRRNAGKMGLHETVAVSAAVPLVVVPRTLLSDTRKGSWHSRCPTWPGKIALSVGLVVLDRKRLASAASGFPAASEFTEMGRSHATENKFKTGCGS